jgi:hypothetical protein
VNRRTFLQAFGACVSFGLLPLAQPIRFHRFGRGRIGVPRARLSPCAACGELKGIAIARDGMAKEASCRCQPSRCRSCGEVIHPRRIGGYYWCERRQALIHVPWFVGMAHVCR